MMEGSLRGAHVRFRAARGRCSPEDLLLTEREVECPRRGLKARPPPPRRAAHTRTAARISRCAAAHQLTHICCLALKPPAQVPDLSAAEVRAAVDAAARMLGRSG